MIGSLNLRLLLDVCVDVLSTSFVMAVLWIAVLFAVHFAGLLGGLAFIVAVCTAAVLVTRRKRRSWDVEK